jgi:hypothetical protein
MDNTDPKYGLEKEKKNKKINRKRELKLQK